MEFITEDGSLKEKELKALIQQREMKFVGDSADFGLSPVPRKENTPPTTEVATKDWGIR